MKAQIAHVIPDQILPTQFYPRRQINAEERLQVAVVEQAWRDTWHPDLRIREDVRDWLIRVDASNPFSFGVICDQIGFNSALLRGAFLDALEQPRGRWVKRAS